MQKIWLGAHNAIFGFFLARRNALELPDNRWDDGKYITPHVLLGRMSPRFCHKMYPGLHEDPWILGEPSGTVSQRPFDIVGVLHRPPKFDHVAVTSAPVINGPLRTLSTLQYPRILVKFMRTV